MKPLRDDLRFATGPLLQMLGADAVCTDARSIAPYLADERGAFKGCARMLVRPNCTADVSRLLAYCWRERVGVVPQGGNTGYCGGGTAFDEAHILLNLDRLNQVREVNAHNYTMTLEAGVTLAEAQEAAVAAGLCFPLSMGSQGSCQIGGALSTNAGGLNALRYGVARDLMLGLEVVLPDGQLISRTRSVRKDNTGYRISDIFVGAEGTLGVITAATLKLFPMLAGRATALLSLVGVEAACDALTQFRKACDDNIVSYELITLGAAQLAADLLDTEGLFSASANIVLILIEAASRTDQRAAQLLQAALAETMEAGLVADGYVAASQGQKERLWRFREGIPEAEKRAGGGIKQDVSVPIQHLSAFMEKAKQAVLAIADARFSIFGHLGDGNIHFNVLAPDGVDAEAWKRAHSAGVTAAILELAESFGGSFSAEHGIGVLKKDELEKFRSPTELDLMRRLKHMLDPRGIMNPGKVL